MLGKTSLPGNDSLGASLIKPDKWSFLANKPTGFSAGLVATFTITFALKMYEEKNTQNTSYTSSPTNSRVETFRLGSRTRAINATHNPIPRASMRSQCPVSTHIHTSIKDRKNDKISAAVNRPHTPNDIFWPVEQGRMRYWHIGNRRKANATVARTAVQIAKTICRESKKRNMMRRDAEAPMGRKAAWQASMVCTLLSPSVVVPYCLSFSLSFSRFSCSKFKDLKLPYTISNMEITKVDNREESITENADMAAVSDNWPSIPMGIPCWGWLMMLC